ncbi:hypothetical protein LCGC14_0163000 [marine sediment metagenome]|uniref:Uncharacterized protein n=1 Tax=marine sediment metagenome TaxID=412755 RepID=A0A0F9XCD0_9ZZZZ
MAKQVAKRNPVTDRLDTEGGAEVGQWYWVKHTKSRYNEETDKYEDYEYEWLGCITEIGSNYVELHSPRGHQGQSHCRVHFDDFFDELRHEPKPKDVIGRNVHKYKALVEEKMAEVKALTARLGVSSRIGIEERSESSSTALVTLSGTDNVKKYENALVKAKDEDLPKLFSEIRSANENLAMWLSAEAVPLEAMAGAMKSCVDDIQDRIFNVSIYAGLTEDVKQIQKGEPADISEKLYLMQRRLYMDEECLLNYQLGGMDFDSLDKFDKWLCEPENLNRVFPFPRCIVSFKVRREKKARDWGGDPKKIFIHMGLENADKKTYLYIRNGERVYWMGCDLEFGLMLFPSGKIFDPTEPMMAKMSFDKVEEMIPVREFKALCKEHADAEAAHKRNLVGRKKWLKENMPKRLRKSSHNLNKFQIRERRDILDKAPYDGYFETHFHSSFRENEWEPFNSTSVYFDEALKEVEDRVKHYNRIALIVQGLFDRSDVLHPHLPVKLWSAEGFGQALELVYDDSNTLYEGERPDFEAYRRKCNESLKTGSVVIGQDGLWQEKEAEKENNRLDGDWRNRSDYRHERFKPYGNPGPGYIAKIDKWQPWAKKAIFRWFRERRSFRRYRWDDDSPLRTTVTVPESRLFNVDAYKPGDYKQFFQDPRTRAGYLQWAPMLIAAEEYHAGNLNIPRVKKPK